MNTGRYSLFPPLLQWLRAPFSPAVRVLPNPRDRSGWAPLRVLLSPGLTKCRGRITEGGGGTNLRSRRAGF